MGSYFKVVLGIFVIFLMLIVGKVVLFPAHVANETVNSAYSITSKTLSADNVIYNYEWFKQQYNDYLAIDKKIIVANDSVANFEKSAGDRKSWTFEDKTEHARLNTIVQGLMSQRADIVSNYNARASMANRSIFQAGVPSFIN